MEYKLEAKKREIKGEKIRSKLVTPAVVYGAGKDNISLTLDLKEFSRLYEQTAGSNLIDLTVDGKDQGIVLVHQVQYDPVTDAINHVDLRRIDMNKEITAMVALSFIGETSTVKEQGGTLLKNTEQVEVKCLPKDLISEIEVDLSALITFEDSIKIKDLSIPAGIVITNPGEDDMVVKAVPALTEEQIKAMEEAEADVSKVEVAGEEEGEEGDEEKKEEGDEKKPEEGEEEKKEDKPEEKKDEKKGGK